MSDFDAEQIRAAAQAMGRKGGIRTRDKVLALDPEYYRKIGQKGGQKTKATYGNDHYKKIGRQGGALLSEKRGPEFYAEIGTKGAQARAERSKPDHEGEVAE